MGRVFIEFSDGVENDLGGEDPCWFYESLIESKESISGDHRVIVPELDWFRKRLDTPRMVHLDMFIQSRLDGVLDMSTTSLIGSHRPDILLVGDQHNPNGPGEVEYRAAFGPWGGCSPYLLDGISSQNYIEWAIVNGYEESDLRSLWETLGTPSAVALGKRAEKLLNELGIFHGSVPHPQYMRRFRSRDRFIYGDMIRESLTA